MLKKINESLKEDVDPNSVPIQLSWIGFLSGVLDATTYSVTNCYASNHTGKITYSFIKIIILLRFNFR